MKTNPSFLNDLYTIKEVKEDIANRRITIQAALNPSHQIFTGHFPGNPVLPGVCTVQIVKELLSDHLKKDLMLKKAGNIKYLSFINPEVNPMINFELRLKDTEEGLLACNAKVFFESTVFCSFKGEFGEMKNREKG
jgi:3-hydroxyacyl-[acyl-carrier-protein] dehydratase